MQNLAFFSPVSGESSAGGYYPTQIPDYVCPSEDHGRQPRHQIVTDTRSEPQPLGA